MIPDVDPSQLEHASEAPVYIALRDQLSDEYVVLHSYPWLRPWRGEGALAEGEADFVVLHPQHGLLVLEVKGGETIRHDGNRWFRDTKDGPRDFQDPFRQARRNMHALLDIAKERSGGRINKEDLVHGYAVVFPHMDYEGQPPPHADKAIVISQRHLSYIDQAINTAFRAWTEQPRMLRHDRYRMLLHDCLMPRFRVFRPIGPDISTAANRLLELTETQAQVFEGLYAQDRVLVEGVAGSGKTFLALLRALAFAREGKRTLFVCYNKELAAWIRRQVAEDPETEEYRELLTIKHFHALAAELAKAADIKFSPAGGGQVNQVFWDDEVPDLMEQAVLALDMTGESVQFDAIVVDEAQDFSIGWWYALTQSLLVVPSGPVYAFMDPNQSLRGEVQWPPIDFDTKFRLTINCRNTRKIAAASASVLNLESHFFARSPAGAQLRLLRANTQSQQKGLVLQELKKLLQRESVTPRQIALIGPSAKENGSLAEVIDIDGVAFVTSVDQWRDGGGLLVTTARSFKGLEADVVILYDLGDFWKLFRKEDLYVACTRARVLLIAVSHGTECRAVINSAIAAAEMQL
jgi:hypothetical protein